MRDDFNKPVPGRLVFSDNVAVKSQPDEMAETRIDLSPALDGGFGQMILLVDPPVKPKNRWEARTIKTWIQATQIGLDAFVDSTDLIGWATSLKDGKPLDGAKINIQSATTSGATRTDGCQW